MCTGYPNVIPGAGKSGTSSLANLLNQSSEIYVSKPKEPAYFVFDQTSREILSPDIRRQGVITDLNKYNKVFAGTDRIRVDASTQYFQYFKIFIERFVSEHPNPFSVKFIIILRNPIERAWSNFQMFSNFGFENLSFEEAISPQVVKERIEKGLSLSYDYLSESFYAERVNAFLEIFPKTKVYLFEDLQNSLLMKNSLSDFWV